MHFRTACNSPHFTKADQFSHESFKKDSTSLYHKHLPYRGWRWSSSWGRWNPNSDESDRSPKSKRTEGLEDSLAWNRSFKKFEKDTAELYELFKRRIDADPFDALFGYSPLYPKRAARRNADDRDQVSKHTEQGPKSRKQHNHDMRSDNARKEQSKDRVHPSGNNVANGQAACTSGTVAAADSVTIVQKYDIDPITMRKIPRKPISESFNTAALEKKSDEASQIPVKPFLGAVSPESLDENRQNVQEPKPNSEGHEQPEKGSGWLKQEGFASEKQSLPGDQPDKAESISRSSPPIESTLDRRIRLQRSSPDTKPKLSYTPRETQTDDVDLLRTSDVRASSGFIGRNVKESETQKQHRRDTLEARFEAPEKVTSELEWKKELANKRQERREAFSRKGLELGRAHHEKDVEAQKAAMEAMETRKAPCPTLDVDQSVAHPEQGEGDMASNVHEFASRERWYKRKAPHAVGKEEQVAVQSTKDRSLVREIRGIYEDTYGIIDTKHRQPGTIPPNTGASESTVGATAVQSISQENDLHGRSEEKQKIPQRQGPLSVQEKLTTLLEQFADDLRSMQKLLRAPEMTPQMREEIFHRNRSMRNASDGITDALSLDSPKISKETVQQAAEPPKPIAVVDSQKQSACKPSLANNPKPSTVYSVLAYDPSIQQVTTAEMSSPGESSSERRVSLSEALSTLTEPAKFLPYLTTLQSQGYEIVSSDTNILVLRKTHKASLPSASPSPAKEEEIEKGERHRSINPIDGTTTQTGNFASPTGFVGEAVLPSLEMECEEAGPKPSGYKVRREEEVFSGPSSSRWEHDRPQSKSDRPRRKAQSRRASHPRRTTKTMFVAGLWTASLCYFVGVATEFLRA
ncbi:MAG: hypothetical protein Q9218_002423 [Villophora microphyllina]